MIRSFYNPRVDDSCADTAEFAECLDGFALVQRHISTPIFISMDLADKNAFRKQGIERGSPQALAYAIDGLANFAKHPHGTFATDLGAHVLVSNSLFYTARVGPDDVTYADVLGNWYFDREGAKQAAPSLK